VAPDPKEAARQEAVLHFERGNARLKEGAWDAALAEFSRSRELFPSRGNTQDTAVCLRELRRYDEALEMFEALLRDFPGTLAQNRAIGAEIAALRPLVGTLDVRVTEPGATVIIDGRARGTTPVSAPLRVKSGTHIVRIYKDGFVPLEYQLEVSGDQNVPVAGDLIPLTRSGRLKVTEQGGKAVPILVDGVVVGTTPWESAVTAGDHVVVLRSGDEGSAPVAAPVRVDDVTALSLASVPLDAELRIEPTPAGATVALDGVTLGRGLWEGKLPHGAHRVEVAAEGFIPATRDLALDANARVLEVVRLERDPASPMWRDPNPPLVVFEVDGGLLVSPEIGGDVSNDCRDASACSRTIPFGQSVMLHGGYQFRSGLLVGLDVGFWRFGIGTTARPVKVDKSTSFPTGATVPASTGAINDSDTIHEYAVGASVGYHEAGRWNWTARFSAGVAFGSSEDDIGAFPSADVAFQPGSTTFTASCAHFYLGPDARYGYRIARNVEVSLGLHLFVLQALSKPELTAPWPKGGLPTTTPAGGTLYFQGESYGGKTTFLVGPDIGLRAGF
jgi:PEGA domain